MNDIFAKLIFPLLFISVITFGVFLLSGNSVYRADDFVLESVSTSPFKNPQQITDFSENVLNKASNFFTGFGKKSVTTSSMLDYATDVLNEELEEEAEQETEQEDLQALVIENTEEIEGIGGPIVVPTTPEDLQNILDDIQEKIDIISQQVERLIAEQEEKEELEEKEEELEEDNKELIKDVCEVGVNINTASAFELEKITGVGPATAQKIISARPFYFLEDLLKVGGIGEKTLQKIKEQRCAYIESGLIAPPVSAGASSAPSPQINISFPVENSVNKEIEVEISVLNLKNASYDIKISILEASEESEQKRTISQIYDDKKEEWLSSSYNYLEEVFQNDKFEGKFRLKIKESKYDFIGEADIIVKIRNNQTGKIETQWQGKINIIESELLSEEPEDPDLEEPDPEEPIVEVKNLLSNEFFEEWNEPADSADCLHNWNYEHTVNTHITRNEDALIGNYSVQWSPITSAKNLAQSNIIITTAGVYYAEIWVKPLNVDEDDYIRISVDIANPIDGSFPNANFTDYKSEEDWIKLAKSNNIEVGENGGIRIRAHRSTAVDRAVFLIGAAWLGATVPPENWPF